MIYLLTVYVMLLFVDSLTLSCGFFVIMLLKTVNLHKSLDVNMLIFIYLFVLPLLGQACAHTPIVISYL